MRAAAKLQAERFAIENAPVHVGVADVETELHVRGETAGEVAEVVWVRRKRFSSRARASRECSRTGSPSRGINDDGKRP